MPYPENDPLVRRLRKQRNFLAIGAISCIASIGLTGPRMVATYRERVKIDSRITELQREIVWRETLTRQVQAQIISAQQEIRLRLKP